MNSVRKISSKTVGEMCIVTVIFYDNVHVDILIYLKSAHEISVDVNVHAIIHDNYHIAATCKIATDIHDKLREFYIDTHTPRLSVLGSHVYSIVHNMNLYKSY